MTNYNMNLSTVTIIGDKIDSAKAEALYLCAAKAVGKPANRPITIHLVDQDKIAELNEKYLNHQGPTDVLSFPLEAIPDVDASPLGDIFICPEEAESRGEPLLFLVLHSLLHLWGYDHVTNPDAWSVAFAQVSPCLPEAILTTLDPHLRKHGFEV